MGNLLKLKTIETVLTVDAHVVDIADQKYTRAVYGETALGDSIFHKRNYFKHEVSR